MPNKFRRKQLAVGHWGSPHRRIELDQTAAKVRVWLQDKLIARGRFVQLYLPAAAGSGNIACTCVKNTTDSAERTCLSCYGTKFIPGYTRFLTANRYWASAEVAAFTLTDALITTSKKANVIVIAEGATTGIIETQDKNFTDNPNLETFEIKVEAFRRATGTTFLLEYSVDAGTTWAELPLTEVQGGTGFTGELEVEDPDPFVIRFRFTMTRADADDLTPAFEIIRMRRVRTEDENRRHIRRRREDYVPGSILILRPWVQEQDSLEPNRGRIIEHQNDRTWTAPLDFFDAAVTHDTPAARVQDALGPHPFYVYNSGVLAGEVYVITKTSFNEQLGIFTHQFFEDRRAQDNESYHLVWTSGVGSGE